MSLWTHCCSPREEKIVEFGDRFSVVAARPVGREGSARELDSKAVEHVLQQV